MEESRSYRFALRSLTALFAIGLFLPAWAQEATITVGEAIHHDTSAPMDINAFQKVKNTGEQRQVPMRLRPSYGRFPDLTSPDGGAQNVASVLGATPATILSVPGLSEQDNIDIIGGAIVPPDINGDIGLDALGNRIYIQYINLIWGVFDVDGTLIHGPFAGNSFWAGFGGFCETNNDGDPIVLYDDQAGRWVFSQFSINQGIQCVAVSTTSDPLGPYHRYAFAVTPGGANDYPKLGVWDDGTTGSAGQSAYTFTTRDFPVGATFGGAGVMERDQMLDGNAAQFIKFSNPCVANECIEGQLPQHLAGPPPPAGTCPTFWTAVDSAFDDSPHANDGYRNHTLCVDWTTIANSTYTEGPLVVAGSNFDRFLAGNTVSPVNGGEPLDALQFFTMYRAQYRWFGSNASVVLNTTVDAGLDRAGIRWAEVRSTDGDSAWSLQQDGTFAPADGIERWMGSIAQDQSGNIALGYTAASSSLFPSVRYTSRMAGDPAGTMAGGEASCHEGTGAQTGSFNRWGDYSSMSVDPTDDCTFWYTQEYYAVTGSFDFETRICSFKIDGCGATMHVEGIVTGTQNAPKGRKFGTAAVTVRDNNGNSVGAGYTVTGDFSGSYNEAGETAITDSNGVASFVSTGTAKKNIVVGFCVSNVTGSPLGYEPADNATGTTCVDPVSVHVDSVSTGSAGVGGGDKAGTATITIVDNNGDPVAGHTVSGDFSDDISESVTGGVTAANGTITYQTTGTARGKVNVSFCVSNVTDEALPYVEGDNEPGTTCSP
ncbi:MAG: hypothetical protein ACI9H8_000746 [Lysobacterales bacterium]|jgi:hypothetical protein